MAHKKWGYAPKPATAPTKRPRLVDIAWAAGIYEGEGCVNRLDKACFAVVQKDPELLYKLRDLFGGTVRPRRLGGVPSGHYRWLVCGTRGRGFAYSIFSFLTLRRREQVRVALVQWLNLAA